MKETAKITMHTNWEVEHIEKFFESRQKVLEKIDSIMKLEKVEKLIEESRKALVCDENAMEELKEDFKINLKSLLLAQIIVIFVTKEKILSDAAAADMISDELIDKAIKGVEKVVSAQVVAEAFSEMLVNEMLF